jgi:hypothetical protein
MKNALTKTERSTLEDILDAVVKADAGDAVALAHVREGFQESPAVADQLSGLAWNAENAILSGVPAGAAELFRQQVTNLRRTLRQEGTGTALESMLIRRIGLDYMASLQADRQRGLAAGETRSLDLARFYDLQADRAHRRFLASVESLARVRKLINPIQINIADQQVNVVGNLTTGTGGTPQ